MDVWNAVYSRHHQPRQMAQHFDLSGKFAPFGRCRIQSAGGENFAFGKFRRRKGNRKTSGIDLGNEFRPHRNAFGTIILCDFQQKSGTPNRIADCAVFRRNLWNLRKPFPSNRRFEHIFSERLFVNDSFRRRKSSPAHQLQLRSASVRIYARPR